MDSTLAQPTMLKKWKITKCATERSDTSAEMAQFLEIITGKMISQWRRQFTCLHRQWASLAHTREHRSMSESKALLCWDRYDQLQKPVLPVSGNGARYIWAMMYGVCASSDRHSVMDSIAVVVHGTFEFYSSLRVRLGSAHRYILDIVLFSVSVICFL